MQEVLELKALGKIRKKTNYKVHIIKIHIHILGMFNLQFKFGIRGSPPLGNLLDNLLSSGAFQVAAGGTVFFFSPTKYTLVRYAGSLERTTVTTHYN